jgi:protein-L-isoaspartate(D-aspartate) O-methyltransferase
MNNIPTQIRNKFIDKLKQQGISNTSVLSAMGLIPRHIFVEEALKNRAYDDDALPIGFNQTISSPYIVGKMTQLIIESDNMEKVLEIGTGCGYQTAILASLFKQVITIERIKPLYEKSKLLLKNIGFKNIKNIYGDGYEGFTHRAPFDAIIMTAAPKEIPEKLVKQLKPNGRMILPLDENGSQKLFRIKNTKNGILKKEVDDVLFVPMLKGTVR